MKKEKITDPADLASTLYVFRNGKYIPIMEHMESRYYQCGDYIMQIRPGHTSVINRIYLTPQVSETLEAALQVCINGMADAMRDTELSGIPDEVRANVRAAIVRVFKKAGVDTKRGYTIPSPNDIINAGIKYLREYIVGLERAVGN